MEKIVFTNNNKTLVILGAVLITLVALSTFRQNLKEIPTPVEPEDLTTHIPKGFRLVPIKVENYKSLDQILGNYALVDVYIKQLSGKKSTTQLIATHVRAIRNHLDATSFGLLIPKDKVKTLLSLDGHFLLTLNNEKGEGTVFVEANKNHGRISYTN